MKYVTLRVFLPVALLLASNAFTQDYLRAFPLRQRSKYFEFHYKAHPEQITAIARFADAYVGILNRDFFKAEYAFPIQVLVLQDKDDFHQFLREHFAVANPPNFGIFLFRHNLFATYEGSGLGTFAHEILHPLVESNLKGRPIWAIEGIPAFFEKFYGYWQNDELVLDWGYQNPWRIQALGTNLTRLDLKAILTTTETPGPYNESDRRMVSMFLWEQGKFKRFLQFLRTGDRHGYGSYFEAAMGIPVEKVVPLWQDYLNRVANQKPQIMRLPQSTIFQNESAFHHFTGSIQ